MHVLVPAKINLHLRVGAARADGFHPLMSWMCTVGLFDTLEFDYAENSGTTDSAGHIRLSCDDPNLPTDERNLVVCVTSSWGRRVYEMKKMRVRSLRASLAKKIPAGAGLGGGRVQRRDRCRVRVAREEQPPNFETLLAGAEK